MKTENLAVAFVDIKGYTTRTSTQSREENQRLLRRFDAVVRPIVRAFGGSVVKNIGDAFLLTYRSPTDALHAAMAMQDRLADLNRRAADGDRFEIRVAVNAGEVRVERGDVFGEAVNIASRIESLADGGEIYFSEAVYLIMNKSEVPFEEVGPRQLKGVPEPVRVFRVPPVPDVGEYRVKGTGRPKEALQPEHPLEPPTLPFGGKSLERIKSRLPDPDAPESASRPDPREAAEQIWRTGRARFREDPTFRWIVVGVAAALILLLVWAAWPKRTPRNRFKRAMKELGFSWTPPEVPVDTARAAGDIFRELNSTYSHGNPA